MKSFTDPHNGGMNTITAACYKQEQKYTAIKIKK